jgi:hypothetical protein
MDSLTELSLDDLNQVYGGHRSNIESIGYAVGSGIGWFYENIMIGNPW